MYQSSQIQNKAGGGGVPIAHPAAAICPRCGGVDAVAFPAEAGTPARYVVKCPGCGTFTWDTVTGEAVAGPGEDAP
jgi:phage FluMu protein Com